MRQVASRAVALRDDAGRPARLVGTNRDVTPEHEAEARLRASDARYHTLFDRIDEGFCVIEVLFEGGEGVPGSDLLRDGGEIQRVVADLHGRQRRRLGWTEDAVAREYAVLAEEIVALVRRHVPAGTGDVDTALDVLRRLLGRAHEASVQAFRHAPPAGA